MRLGYGSRLGQYQILERIGRGGMGTVYKAHHRALDRFIAIKVLPDFFAEDDHFLVRFQQEARTVARLNHPNILTVFDFGHEAETAYLVMEFVAGGTLADRLGKPMGLKDAVRLLRPLASALDHAHGRGVLHRDIKPANILIRDDGTPVLADFGLAQMAESVNKLTVAGTVLGTPEYMSPEQIAGEPLGPATDRYSLAVVAYEMLTGRAPYQAETPGAVLLSHLQKSMPPMLELVGELSAHAEEVLQKGLAKDPADRFPSASQLVAALTPAAWPSRLNEESDVAEDCRRQPKTHARTARVLVVDDGRANRELIEACLAGVDCQIDSAEDGVSALKAIDSAPPDLVLLDVQMPGMDGYEVCRHIKATHEGRLLPVVMITALDSVGDRVEALASGADDFMSKPVDRVELIARVRSALRLKSVYDSLASAEQVILSLAAAVEAKDALTKRHTHRVGEAARHLGQRLGLPESDLDTLYRGGVLHDIGKIGIPDAILHKQGRLDLEEWDHMRAHTSIGEGIVRPLRSGSDLLPIIRHHHEHFDGNGYPDGLRGHEIPLGARIVSVCDAFDALVTDRPYRDGRSVEDATATLIEGAGTQWDPELVDLFIREIPAIQKLGAA